MDSDDDDDVQLTLHDFWRTKALAHACEWCYYDQQFGICNGQGKECRAMALYHEAQTRARLTSLCRDSIHVPVCASLQDRIVALITTSASLSTHSQGWGHVNQVYNVQPESLISNIPEK